MLSLKICNKNTTTSTQLQDINVLAMLPETVSNLQMLTNAIRVKIGLIILYKDRNNSYLDNLVYKLKSQDYIIDILKENYVTLPLHINSPEGRRVLELVSEGLLYPAFIFTHNKKNNFNLTRSSIINKLEGEVKIEDFRDALIKNIDIRESRMNESSINSSSIIEEQKRELEQLERLEEEKKRDMKERQRRQTKEVNIILTKLEDKKIKLDELNRKQQEKLKQLPVEPGADNPEATKIVFRYPDGSCTAERRFLKTDKVKVYRRF
jgi:hypothetical protein